MNGQKSSSEGMDQSPQLRTSQSLLESAEDIRGRELINDF